MSVAATAERMRHTWRRFFTPPIEMLDEMLVDGEDLRHADAPALRAFFVEELPLLLLAVVAGGAIATVGARTEHLTVSGLALVGAGGVLMYLRIKRWNERYTAYVLTSWRVIRVSGFLNRSVAWVPWAKVTDVRFEVTFLGRLFGYATVLIDSANEESGLKEMRNLTDPATFYTKLTELVQLKQGGVSAPFEPFAPLAPFRR